MSLRLACLASLLALALAGCPGSPTTPPETDGGIRLDAPAEVDAGLSETDGGTPSVDAGTAATGTDGGAADAGAPGTDAGGPPSPCTGCNSGEYCNLCLTPPACEARPDDLGRICTGLYDPVCGCDGVTYSNACALGSAAIGQLHDGECDAPPPPPGGCVDDRDCGPGQHCATCRGPGGGVNVCLSVGTDC